MKWQGTIIEGGFGLCSCGERINKRAENMHMELSSVHVWYIVPEELAPHSYAWHGTPVKLEPQAF